MGSPPRIALPDAPDECRPHLSAIERIARYLAADDRVRACWLVGSFATGTSDAYSDVDMEAAASPAAVADFLQTPSAVLSRGGDVLYQQGGGSEHFARFGAIYRGPLIIDLSLCSLEAGPIPRRGCPVHVLFDPGGILAEPERLSDALPRDEETHLREVAERLAKFWFWALTAVRFLRRGNCPWASGFLAAMRATLAQLLWLSANPGASTGFPVPCGWGMVRTDLDASARDQLDACISADEVADLPSAIRQCMSAFGAVGRAAAQRVGCAYPEAFEREVMSYARGLWE
jgi:hypothetical protein